MMDAFLHACGVHPALELEIETTSSSLATRYCLRQPFALVGRHPAADLYLDSEAIRPKHIYLQAIEGRVACINISMTGTIQTSEAEVENFIWLAPQQSVQFGHRSVKLLQEQAGPPVRTEVKDPLAPGSAWEIFGPRVTLELLNEEEGVTRKAWLVDRLITLLGRSPRCAVQLHHEEVSNVHCSLVLTSTGLYVVDLLGRGGIFVNERPVRAAPLGLEDALRVGPFLIRLAETPVPFPLPEEARAFRPRDAGGETVPTTAAAPGGSHHQVRLYHTPWPEDASQADVLEELMDNLQNMHGPQFEQYQQVIRQMVSTLEHLSPEQLVEVKKELKRLHALSLELELVERKEGIPDPFGADATGLVLPDEPVPASEPGMSYTSEVVRPDELDPPSQPRSALSLLKDPDTSVFRLPRKKGELFETVNIVKSEASSSSGSWADRQTEMLNDSLVQEAQQLQQQYGAEHPATEGYGYESEANGLEPVSEAEYAQAAAALQQSAAVQQSDREEQRAALQHEQSSIWRKLSGVFFGKGK